MKTIATISTPLVAGAIGIIRMTGDDALRIAARMFRSKQAEDFTQAQPNRMYYGTVTAGDVTDKALAVYFRAPHSYTGEDLVEFQCHGGVRLMRTVYRACLDLGAQAADKGEFTKRAFLNGKYALSDCEGIVDLIQGESMAAVRAASRQAQGALARRIGELNDQLLDGIGELEASLDYPDEMEDEARTNARQWTERIYDALRALRDTAQTGAYIRNGIAVAIVGNPNVGKSSLLNRLLGQDRAIVTDIAGTTRDTLEVSIEVRGILLRLIDTAGIRESEDAVERIGVERSKRSARTSDVVLHMIDASRPADESQRALERELRDTDAKLLRVYNKTDLPLAQDTSDGIALSATQGIGIETLRNAIVDAVVTQAIDPGAEIVTNERHVRALDQAIASVRAAADALDVQPTECILLDLRNAYFALGEITGHTASEDIVDRIFSKFCLGK